MNFKKKAIAVGGIILIAATIAVAIGCIVTKQEEAHPRGTMVKRVSIYEC